jgi:hypothetical protein
VVLDGQKVQLPSNGCERGWIEVWGPYDDDAYLVQVLQERRSALLIAKSSALGFDWQATLIFRLEMITGGTLLRITEENIDKSLLGLFLGRLYSGAIAKELFKDLSKKFNEPGSMTRTELARKWGWHRNILGKAFGCALSN